MQRREERALRARPRQRLRHGAATHGVGARGLWSRSQAPATALLMSEGVLPPLIRLAESGSHVEREKAAITLQRLSAASPDAARAVVRHGGAGPLIALIFYA